MLEAHHDQCHQASCLVRPGLFHPTRIQGGEGLIRGDDADSCAGVLEAIYWAPGVRWVIEAIHVLRPIAFQACMRNEVKVKAHPAKAMRAAPQARSINIEEARAQRSTLFLVNVAYVIEAHVELHPGQESRGPTAKHLDIFRRRARHGRCFHSPYLGTRECAAAFELIEDTAPLPPSCLAPEDQDRDLGRMLFDIDHANGAMPRFVSARLVAGVLDVRACLDLETRDDGASGPGRLS